MSGHTSEVRNDLFGRGGARLFRGQWPRRCGLSAAPDFLKLGKAGASENFHQPRGVKTPEVGCGSTGPVERQDALP